MSDIARQLLLNVVLTVVLFAGWVGLDWVYIELERQSRELFVAAEIASFILSIVLILIANMTFLKCVSLYTRIKYAVLFLVVDLILLFVAIVTFGIAIHFRMGGTL